MLLKEQYPLPLGRNMNVLITQPDDLSPDEKLPLIVFLHGMGERGNDYDLLCTHGVSKLFSKDPCHDGIRAMTLCPQCPDGLYWDSLSLFVEDIIASLVEAGNVDPQRISLTGLSMGGYGTWAMACNEPKLFSAIAPLCGGGNTHHAFRLISLPIRVYHGDADPIVPPSQSEMMVDAVRQAGGQVDYTLLPGVDHNCWDYAYEETDLLHWLTEQIKKD